MAGFLELSSTWIAAPPAIDNHLIQTVLSPWSERAIAIQDPPERCIRMVEASCQRDRLRLRGLNQVVGSVFCFFIRSNLSPLEICTPRA